MKKDKKGQARPREVLGVSAAACASLHVHVLLFSDAHGLSGHALRYLPAAQHPAPSSLHARGRAACKLMQTPSNPSSLLSEPASFQLYILNIYNVYTQLYVLYIIFRFLWGTEHPLLLCACADLPAPAAWGRSHPLLSLLWECFILLLPAGSVHPQNKVQGCLFGVKFGAARCGSKAERSFTMTQMGATLKTSSQHPRLAAPPESGHDLFPLPHGTATSPDVRSSSRTPKPYPDHSPELLKALHLPEQAACYELFSSASSQPGLRVIPAEPLDIPWWPQSLGLNLG